MSIVGDIAASYGAPGMVLRRRLAMGEREDRALAILMAGCTLVFVAQWPRLAREAALSGEDLPMMLGSTLFAWLFIMPLVLYSIAFASYLLMRVTGGLGSSFAARLSLFWALLASGPVMLIYGLLAGFVGPGWVLSLFGVLWLALFFWFWFAGLKEARRGAEE